MRTCDSVIQNHCRIQGRCVFGGIRSTACLGESNHLHSYLYPNDTRPQARKSRKQCAELCEVGHRAVLRSPGFSATVKT